VELLDGPVQLPGHVDVPLGGQVALVPHKGLQGVLGDAFNNNTVMDVLRPRASLEEIMDEKGKGTGKFRTVVQYATTDSETGEPLTLSLTARAAVERMQAEPARYGNLFKAGLRSGIGSSAGPAIGSGGKIDIKNMSQEAYMKIRAENPALLGLRPQKGKSGR